jgi:2-hydroxychromene-2-carboxylate isomerase
MSFQLDLFWSFRSPYSYLATPRLVEMRRNFDIDVVVRPVYPIALRIPGFFKKVNPLWPPYLLRDCARIAEMNGIPFAWPSPDPIVQDLATLEVAAEQPHIHRLTRLGVAANRRDRGLAFIDEVSRLIFGGVRGWHVGDHLERAAARAGLDLAELDAAITADPASHETEIEGVACVPSVHELPDDVKSISVITPPAVTDRVVQDAIAKGIKNVWMQPGAESEASVEACRQAGINVIADGSCVLVVLGYRER